MKTISYRPLDWRPPNESRMAPKLLLLAALLITGTVLVGAYALPAETPSAEGPPIALGGLSQLVFPAPVIAQVEQPAGEPWTMPVAAAVVGNTTFVLDTGNNRVLKLDPAGRVLATFDTADGGGPPMQQPLAIASDGIHLFIANSLAADLLVLDLTGRLQRVVSLEAAPGEPAPRPIGVAVMPGGGLAVSDADNHRVLRLDGEGHVLWSAGTGARAGGQEGFNVPGALTVDGSGNIYVVDTLNGRVVELSPDGAFLRQFGRLGDSAGTLSRPKGVAVDAEGRVFVSDGLLAAVEVFAADGTYVGFIGRRDPADPTSPSLFQAPAGLLLAGETLYVTDRFAGLVTFDLSSVPPPAPATTGEETDSGP